MDVRNIVAEIDAKIASLQQARAVLIGLNEGAAPVEEKRRRGRPKGSTNAARAEVKAAAAPKRGRRRRNLSPEGRKRIADAMKLRWEEHRNAAPKAAKKTVGKKEAATK
ncbi:MAG: hypothetical protein ACP5E5_01010 [Acidobacteriaceae bacterium]